MLVPLVIHRIHAQTPVGDECDLSADLSRLEGELALANNPGGEVLAEPHAFFAGKLDPPAHVIVEYVELPFCHAKGREALTWCFANMPGLLKEGRVGR